MDIISFINKFTSLVEAQGYTLYFGTRQMYNTQREFTHKEIILEPFPLHIGDVNEQFQTDFTISLLHSYDVSAGDGIDLANMQLLLNDMKQLLAIINDSEVVLITRNIESIPMQYYPVDSNNTPNTQAILRCNFPIIINQSNG